MARGREVPVCRHGEEETEGERGERVVPDEIIGWSTEESELYPASTVARRNGTDWTEQ